MNHSKFLKNFFIKFIPSKEISIVCILFYLLGIVFAFMNPDQAHLTFSGGMFLDNIEVQIQVSSAITFNYIVNQFVFYLGAVCLDIFLNNLVLMILSIFSGIAIIPTILIGLFMKMGATTFFVIEKWGYTGFAVLFGSFHIYFEFLAAILAIEAFFNFYISLIDSFRQHDLNLFKKNVLNEFIPLLLRIILLLAIGAVLEVFWSTWWVYIHVNHYISWYDFYF